MIQNYQLATLNAELARLRTENQSLRQQLRGQQRTLILPVRACYFYDIKSGTKPEEYRLCNEYWSKRLINREYDQVVVTLGYPKADDTERRLVRPWLGYIVKTISHQEFGSEPVTVFAINVKGTP